MLQKQSQGHLRENSLLLREGRPFVLFRPSTHWMRLTHVWRAICFTRSLPISMWASSITPWKHREWCLAKYLGIVAQPSRHVKLPIAYVEYLIQLLRPRKHSLTGLLGLVLNFHSCLKEMWKCVCQGQWLVVSCWMEWCDFRKLSAVYKLEFINSSKIKKAGKEKDRNTQTAIWKLLH